MGKILVTVAYHKAFRFIFISSHPMILGWQFSFFLRNHSVDKVGDEKSCEILEIVGAQKSPEIMLELGTINQSATLKLMTTRRAILEVNSVFSEEKTCNTMREILIFIG
jgi:hypothetical protein